MNFHQNQPSWRFFHHTFDKYNVYIYIYDCIISPIFVVNKFPTKKSTSFTNFFVKKNTVSTWSDQRDCLSFQLASRFHKDIFAIGPFKDLSSSACLGVAWVTLLEDTPTKKWTFMCYLRWPPRLTWNNKNGKMLSYIPPPNNKKLFGGFNPFEKSAQVKLDGISLGHQGENSKNVRNRHHLGIHVWSRMHFPNQDVIAIREKNPWCTLPETHSKRLLKLGPATKEKIESEPTHACPGGKCKFQGWYLEDHRHLVCKLGSPPFISHEKAIYKGSVSHNPSSWGRTGAPWFLTT